MKLYRFDTFPYFYQRKQQRHHKSNDAGSEGIVRGVHVSGIDKVHAAQCDQKTKHAKQLHLSYQTETMAEDAYLFPDLFRILLKLMIVQPPRERGNGQITVRIGEHHQTNGWEQEGRGIDADVHGCIVYKIQELARLLQCLYLSAMKRALFSFLFCMIACLAAQAQPKLVVGIVVDQMRFDYLTRYGSRFCDSGFKRLMNEGFSYENGQYNYVPTYTGPGHASIYTGTTPSVHGIIGNDWYDRMRGDFMYCTEDSGAKMLGAKGGGQSPKNLLSSTLTDQLALATQFRSKIVGISVKDRGAVLPAGHAATGAFWYDSKTGKLVSSSWYGSELPAWLNTFNKQGKALHYLDQVWNPLYPLNTYTASAPDDNPYENSLEKGGRPVFPYDLKALQADWGYKLLSFTPFSNTYLVDATLAAIEGEKLGESGVSDFLCLSFSGPDYMGHHFGPQAVEMEDAYLRLDLEIARLLYELDMRLGKGNYTVFLTADHGGNEVPALLKEHGMYAGLLQLDSMDKRVKKAVIDHFADSLVLGIVNEQVYFDHDLMAEKGLDPDEVARVVSEALKGFPGVYRTYTVNELMTGLDPALEKFRNGYHPLRSGDLIIHTLPGWMDHGAKGTTHGSGYSYDTRIPMLFYGYGVKPGKSSREVAITDIAPSISLILGIQFPNGNTGKPLPEMLGY